MGDGVFYVSGTYTGIYVAEFPGIAKPGGRDFSSLPELPKKPFDANEGGFFSSGPELTNPTRAVAINGDIAYTANVWDGVKIFRLSGGGIRQVGRANIQYAADVKRSGDRLYVAEGRNGIGVYRLVSDTELEEIGRLKVLEKNLNFAQFLWAFEGSDIVAATCASPRLNFVDFSNPADPKVVSSESGNGLLYGNYASQQLVNGRYFALSRTFGGLMVFDLKGSPPAMIWHDNFPLCSQTGNAAALDSEFLVMRACGYALLDPERPVPTRDLRRFAFPGQGALPPDITDDSAISRSMFPKSEWEGLANADKSTGKVAVANRMFKNIRIYDFSDRDSPKLLKTIALNANPFVPAFWRGRVVLPCGYSGLLLER